MSIARERCSTMLGEWTESDLLRDPLVARAAPPSSGDAIAYVHRGSFRSLRSCRAQADIQSFFGVTPPTVHNMVVELERRGLIGRLPRQARSLTVLVEPDELPRLLPQSIETSVPRC